MRWTDDLLPDETPRERRLRVAACALSDIGWRDDASIRAAESFRRLLEAPFIGVDHAERVYVAAVVHARYAGGATDDAGVAARRSACCLPSSTGARSSSGRALMLGYRLSGSVPEILASARLKIGSWRRSARSGQGGPRAGQRGRHQSPRPSGQRRRASAARKSSRSPECPFARTEPPDESGARRDPGGNHRPAQHSRLPARSRIAIDDRGDPGAASRAPSGTNIQPWRVHVLTGAARQGADRGHHRAPASSPGAGGRVSLLPRRMARTLSRPPAQGRLGIVRASRHRKNRPGGDARAAQSQFRLFRRAGRDDVHPRP